MDKKQLILKCLKTMKEKGKDYNTAISYLNEFVFQLRKEGLFKEAFALKTAMKKLVN